ncbi:MAG: FeoB-associated Cys-rich membrane protein [Marinisporobacter sp.]|jgi:hypothetical protein|nr:FeoB-associated Cys-rich membrane protein [Marinisporobacter sp.]
MENIIAGVVILSIIGLSIAKVVKEKKKGVKCIGCPYAGLHNENTSCSCNIEK